MSKPSVMPPPSIGDVIISILQLSEVQFDQLNTFTHARGFNPKKAEVDELRRAIDTPNIDFMFLFPALDFLFDRISDLGGDESSFTKALEKLVDDVAADAPPVSVDKGVLLRRLRDLLTTNNEHKSSAKKRRISAGFLPNALGFSSFVDIRPDFSDDEVPVVQGHVPIVQFRIRTDSNLPNLRTFVFQLDIDTLAELKKAIVRAESKLASIVDFSFPKNDILGEK